MSEQTTLIRRTLVVAVACVALAAAGITAIWWLSRSDELEPENGLPDQVASFPLPPFTESAYLNLEADARYIGIAACAECHRGNHASFLHTSHSKALGEIDPKSEPPDSTFRHDASGKTYRVYRQGAQLRHEELLKADDGTEIARLDFPIRYRMGSGHVCRTYAIEVDGFLHESPITWYATRHQWSMSPGYNGPQHWSFERQIRVGCMNCHAGRSEAIEGTSHKLAVHEQPIGCERCHGPGSKHAERHRANKRPVGEDDPSIVNPGKLPRERLEAVCADCHLSGVATIPVRGRQATDFRPGRPLNDYRIDFKFDSGSEQMTVVGHMEQLRRSACYKKSPEMSCLSCHDPHAKETPKDPVAFHREKCLSCHTTHGCSVPEVERRKKQPADSCAACHMPRGATDIPHVAFTHHRIGRHAGKPGALPDFTPDLVTTDDDSRYGAMDRKRNLGLAYHRVSQNGDYPRYSAVYAERARELLEAVQAAGMKEGITAEALAELYWKKDQKDPEKAMRYARQAIDAKDLPGDLRVFALMIVADGYFQEKKYKDAIRVLEEMIRLRRSADDWRMLGACYLFDNEPRKAEKALLHALEIRPTRPDIHAALADVYRRLGDDIRTKQHLEKARWLEQHEQR